MINSRLLTLFAALVASAPADYYGFLIATKCTNVSDDCANVPEIMPNLALRPNLASMRDPHELNSHRGGAPPRRNSWHFDNLFDSDLIQVPSQGDVASSALAWAKRLVHIAGPSCPYGYSVTLGSYSAASADNVKALVLDQLFLLENHTPTRGPTSGMFILSKSTALIIPLRHNADMMIGRRIAGPEAVIFLHRGALDECFDFERLPPRSPSSDARRERRLARRIRNWYRTVGARIIGHRRTKTMSDQLEEIHSSRKRWQQRVEFLIADLPEYASAVEKWAHDAVPHRLAVTVATSVTAVTRFTAATVFTLCGIYTDTVVNAVSVECKTKVYNAIRISAELLVELLPQLWLSAREGACDLVENMLLPVNFVITLVMWLPTVLCYYALAPSWCKFKQYHRAVVAYEAAVLKTQALFVAENVALANGRQLIDRPFPISMPVLRSAANQARFSRTCRLVGRAADRDVDYFREHLQIPPAPPSWFEQLVSLCLIAIAAALRLVAAIVAIAVCAAIRFPYRVFCNLMVFLVLCSATLQYGIVNYLSVDPFVAAMVSIAAVTWVLAGSLPRRPLSVAVRLRAVRPLLFLACLQTVAATGTDDRMKCPTFDGSSMTWTAWYIAFTAWVAWKEPRLVEFLKDGASSCPTPSNWLSPTPEEITAVEEWNLRNVRLYGSVLLHVSEPLKVSLHTAAHTDGCGAIEYLRKRFGAHSSGDRTEATARMQRSFIDPRAPMSTDDLSLQYNEICQAVADYTTAGGTKPDGEFLISLFENALPASYAQVRQMLRYRKHTDFEVYYQDILEQVKAEVKSVSQPALGAFAAQGGRRDGGRTNPNQTQGGGLGLGANPCFNCGATTHTRDKCPDPKVKCGHCGGGHMSSLCPKGPGSALRDSLSAYAKRALARSVKDKKGKEDKDKGGAHSVQAPPASSSTVALQTPDEAQLAAQFRAYRAGKAAAAAGRAGASSSSSSSAPPAQPVAPEGLAEPDEMEEFMSAINRTTALIAARRDYHKALLSSPPVIRRGLLSAVACVDSQASSFVVPSVDYLLRVTDAKPSFTIATANGDTYPVAVGVAGVHLQDESGRWHYFEVDGVIVLPQCDRVLYSWPTMARAGVKHMLDDNYLLMPNGGRVPVSTGLTVEASFGPPPAISAHPATIGSGRSSDHEGDPVRGASSAPSKTGRGSDSAASVPQSLLWQRLGFPSEHAWRHSREVIIDHGLPSSTSLRFDFGVVDAVARARTRSLPFHKLRDPSEVPAPGAVLYLDYAGPLTASYPHKFEYYCGVVDAGSGFSRLFACHGPTKEVAKRAMETLLADISALMGLTHALKPQVVVTDQGSAFMSKYFSDFLADSQVRHWPSTAYTPQQNAYVERMWGTRFSMARALLAHANLGPSWHPWALQTANWILNRLPQPSRGNLSSYFILSRAPASVAYLRTFGCLVRVLVPLARRDGDRHFADRGRLGICLGPSEACPGACVYIPSTRTFVVSREVVFYEDTLPGVKGVDAAWRDVHASSGDEGAGGGGALPTPSGFVSPSLPHVPPHPSTPPPAPTVAPAPAPAPSPSPPTQAAAPTTPAFEVAPTAPAEPDLTVDNGLHVLPEQQQSKYFQRGLGPIPVKRERKQAVQHNVSTFKGKSYAANSQFIDPTTADQQGAIHNCVLLDDLVYAGHPTFVYEGTIGGLSAYKAVQTSVVTNLGDIPIPRGYRQALEGRWSSYWREAICKELNGLMGRGTWHYVYLDELPEGTNIMGCHMVFTVKRLSDGAIEKFKCRLVANGNTQKEGVDFDRIFSTVVKITTIRVVLAISAARDYNLTSIDVQQAFLHGKLEEDLYMQMPPGLPSRSPDGRRIVVKLDRSIYGLKQAGRVWWQLFTGFLLEWGFKQSSIDVCFYTYTSPTGSILWLLVWVDDTIIVDDDEGLRERFVTDLGARFPIDDKHELEWILGVKVSRNRKSRTLTLSQELYVQDLCKRHASLIDGLTKRFDSPADPKIDLSPEQSPEVGSPEWERMQRYRADYMALIGAYLWLANVTRPELSFIASRLARFVSNPGAVHYSAAIRVLIYLQGSTSRVLHFRPTATRPLRIFVDSDWATKFSVSGAVFEVMGCAVHWFSKTQRSVSLSSTEAEWFAAMVAAREGMYFRDLLTELGISLLGATALRSDNKSVKELSLDSIAFKKTKHILRAAHFLRDLCDRQFFQVIWIAGTQNPADLLTKVHDLSTFRAYVSLLDHLDGIE